MKKLIAMILTLTLVFALAACGGNGGTEVKSADLQAFYDATFAAGENMPVMGVMEGEALDAFYPGLSELELKQCIVAAPMMTGVAVEVALVEVADAADLETVKGIFEARVAYQIEGGAFYPAVAETWENHVEIVTNGNTMMLIAMNPNADIVEGFNALFA